MKELFVISLIVISFMLGFSIAKKTIPSPNPMYHDNACWNVKQPNRCHR